MLKFIDMDTNLIRLALIEYWKKHFSSCIPDNIINRERLEQKMAEDFADKEIKLVLKND